MSGLKESGNAVENVVLPVTSSSMAGLSYSPNSLSTSMTGAGADVGRVCRQKRLYWKTAQGC